MVSIKGLFDNLDIKTDMKTISTVAVKLTGSSVPVGMKRYITYLKLNNQDKNSNTVLICSSTNSNTAVSSTAKDKITLANTYDLIAYPEKPTPLFSIAESKFVTAISNKGKAFVFVQYYDS